MKKIAAFALIAMLSGCASMHKRAMDTTVTSSLRDKSIAYVIRPMPEFMAMTPAKAWLGGIYLGTALAYYEGSNIIKENKVDNPAGAIALSLATGMSKEFGMKLVADPINIYDDRLSDTDISTTAKKSADFVVDVSTYNWGSGTYPLNFARYGISYSGFARVINTTTESVIAEGYCSYTSGDVNNAPSYDELFGNGAARLKQEMALVTTNCVKNIQMDMGHNGTQ